MDCASAAVLPDAAEQLNRGCACRFLDREHLQQQLEASPALAGIAQDIAQSRPNLFSATMVYINAAQSQAMQEIVTAVQSVLMSGAWDEYIKASAPAIALLNPGPHGVFFGFDFHLGANGPQLIEINTNAGGAYLNLALARAQTLCCAELASLVQHANDIEQLEGDWLAMFLAEWQRQRGTDRPQHIAIVDDAPQQQYLYPEFRLFQQMFEQAGISASIADPAALRWDGVSLWLGERQVDMVYNRLTDFYLAAESSAALRQAFVDDAVVLTPLPRAHAMFADKRHLAVLSDEARLIELGVSATTRATLLAGVPRTRVVSATLAQTLWAERRQLFFKPANGFGSRAAYRGDKLTKRVWEDICAGDYVAQAIIAPSERLVAGETGADDMKLDVRAYVYDGNVQLYAARLYHGQTTNFRTLGGGFAPVFLTTT